MLHRRPEVQRSWRNDPEQDPPEERESGDQEGEPQDGDSQDGDPQDADSQSGEPQGGDPEGADSSDGDPSDGEPSDADSGREAEGTAGSAQGNSSEIQDLLSDEAQQQGEAKPTEQEKREARALNDQLNEDTSDTNWESNRKSVRHKAGVSRQEGGPEEAYTEAKYGTHTAEKIEDKIREFAYEINQNDVGTDWSPQEIEDHRVARMFSVIVGKLAEDISYQEIDGNEFWDAKKIMKRQVDNRPLHSCKKDYKQRKLALLVDTSPSCRDEAILYSKIASGAMLRDDIDIFLCPNGHIDARFDRDRMEFVYDPRNAEWDLDGRTILYFTDWDGVEQICHHSRSTNLYWFDNCNPEGYWNANDEGTREIRSRFRGTHHHCPDKDTFVTLARKIRP